MRFKQVINTLNGNPRKLFLIDGFGVMLSAFLLGVILVKLEYVFGIPPSTLYLLALLPAIFAIYDFYCYQNKDGKLGTFLKGIAITNLIYCCLSIGFAFYHYQEITYFGWIYIVLEIIIVIALVELSVAKRLIRETI